MSAIRTAILVGPSSDHSVSDTASADIEADLSGPTIQEILANRVGYDCKHLAIVPDEVSKIQATVKSWCEGGDVDWIITTGGTGFGVRDRTPEAISPLLDREAPGLVHLLLSASLNFTPLAALSRPVAGTIGNTLVVTLPGSVKAVNENLRALLANGVVDHAVDLIKGGTGKLVHAALASSTSAVPAPASSDHSHSEATQHDHHHHSHHAPQPRAPVSHDPSLSVSARHRVSPYPLISFEQAIESIFSKLAPLEVVTRPVTSALRGYVLAEDVYAPENVPSSQRSNVDGYALRSSDQAGIYQVLTPQIHSPSHRIPPGFIYRINTGSPLPVGTDAVIMVEDTRLIDTFKDDNGEDVEEMKVQTLAQVPVGENVRAPGSDVEKGSLVLRKGTIIHSAGGEIGTLAFIGRKEVQVYNKPTVALFSTGDEIVDLQGAKATSNDKWGGIWDTNRPSLQAALEGMGYKVVDLGIVRDNTIAHQFAIEKGLEVADLLLATGGTSMGASDLLKPVIERQLDGTIHFGRVTVKPGKPTTFATIPCSGRPAKPIFALPGNPASALVTFQIFVVPALRKLGGWSTEYCQLPRLKVQAQHVMNLDPRTEFHRVVIRAEKEGLKAYSTGGQRSSRMASMSGINGLVVLPGREENGRTKVQVGEYVEAIVVGEIQML